MILGAAAQLDGPQVLMLNATRDEVFRTEDVHVFFNAIPGQKKRLFFWDGGHDDWPDEAIQLSVGFINEHT